MPGGRCSLPTKAGKATNGASEKKRKKSEEFFFLVVGIRNQKKILGAVLLSSLTTSRRRPPLARTRTLPRRPRELRTSSVAPGPSDRVACPPGPSRRGPRRARWQPPPQRRLLCFTKAMNKDGRSHMRRRWLQPTKLTTLASVSKRSTRRTEAGRSAASATPRRPH